MHKRMKILEIMPKIKSARTRKTKTGNMEEKIVNNRDRERKSIQSAQTSTYMLTQLIECTLKID